MHHSRNTMPSYLNRAPVIAQTDLPYCLTVTYQGIVSKITSSEDRGMGKKTGIWDPKEQND